MEQRAPLRSRVKMLAGLVGLLWIVEAADWILGGQLHTYGVRPQEWSGLWGIPLMPFLHAGWDHVAANSVALAVLGWLVLLRGTREFLDVSVEIVLLGGLGTWLIGKPHTVHVGASGLILGYFGFLVLRGLIDMSFLSIVSAVVVVLLYGGLIWAVLPSQPAVSWEAHLCGLLAGMVSAWRRGPQGSRRKWRW